VSLNACQQQIKTLLDGLAVPTQSVTLTAYVETPPVVDTTTGPVAYIWGGHGDENRLTIPRGGKSPFPSGGQKRVEHTTDIILQWTFEVGTEYEQLFPLVIDAVRAQLRGQYDLSTTVIDPTTGEQSVMTDLGERIIWDYATPVSTSPEGQALRLNRCGLRVIYHEIFRG
jgi:hypothetical protein